MPTGIYERTPAMRTEMEKNLAKGRSKAARAKARISILAVWDDENKRRKVSEYNKKRMKDPEVRKKHLKGLKNSFQKSGRRFKGGNGQVPTKVIKLWASILIPQGFKMELGIKTRKQDTGLSCPSVYKVDFGRKTDKIAIELDGESHRPLRARKKDHKKQTILKNLGWKVFRVKHGKKV